MKNLKWCAVLFGVVVWVFATNPCELNAMEIDDLMIVAANDVTPKPLDAPVGQTGQETSLLPEDADIASDSDILGVKGGYFHPYLNIYGEWSDNLYNDIDGEEVDSFMTRVSPGIWFSLPRKKVIPISLSPHNSTPGGLQNQLKESGDADRFMSYALIGGDFKYYDENSNLDDFDFVAEGLLRYNFAGGLSLQLVDRYTESEDEFSYITVTRDEQRPRFDSNFLMATIDWDVTEKLSFKFDYTNFSLGYDEIEDQYKDRSDNAYDIYGKFAVSEKTTVFLQYRYVDIEYDVATVNDSTQDFYYGGINWQTTEKLSLMLKLGSQERDFEDSTKDDPSGTAIDFQVNYRYSEKTGGGLSLYKLNEETDSTEASDKDVFGVRISYAQEFTEKLTGSIDFTYEDADYSQLVEEERDEQTISIRPALQYTVQEWLRFELAYKYEDVSSTQDIEEYTTNVIMFGVNLAI